MEYNYIQYFFIDHISSKFLQNGCTLDGNVDVSFTNNNDIFIKYDKVRAIRNIIFSYGRKLLSEESGKHLLQKEIARIQENRKRLIGNDKLLVFSSKREISQRLFQGNDIEFDKYIIFAKSIHLEEEKEIKNTITRFINAMIISSRCVIIPKCLANYSYLQDCNGRIYFDAGFDMLGGKVIISNDDGDYFDVPLLTKLFNLLKLNNSNEVNNIDYLLINRLLEDSLARIEDVLAHYILFYAMLESMISMDFERLMNRAIKKDDYSKKRFEKVFHHYFGDGEEYKSLLKVFNLLKNSRDNIAHGKQYANSNLDVENLHELFFQYIAKHANEVLPVSDSRYVNSIA